MNRCLLLLPAVLLVAADPAAERAALKERAKLLAKMPTSRMARPIDPHLKDILVLDPAGAGAFKTAGQEGMLDSAAKLEQFFKDQYAAREKQATPVKTAVALRVDRNASVASLYDAARAAQLAGFPALYLQVLRKPGEEGRLELFLPDWHRPVEDVTVLAAAPVGEGSDLGPLSIKAGPNPAPVENLAALEKALAAQRGKEDIQDKQGVRIRPERSLTGGALIAVMDACLASGFTRVTVGPLLDKEETKTAKLPAPSTDEQAGAAKEIKTIFAAQYTKPATLPRKLREAAEICDDPTTKFVLLREAADASGRAGQLPESMEAFDQLGQTFTMDVWPLKLGKFKKAPANQAVVDAALHEASTASLQNRRDYAARFVRIAELTAKQTKDKELTDYVEERRELLKLPKLDRLDPFAAPGKRPSAADNEPSAAFIERTTPKEVSVLSLVLWYGVPVVFVGVLLTAGVIWWMRKERAVRSRLSQARGKEFDLPSGEEPGG
jgi:biopolymer transport protein ExbD